MPKEKTLVASRTQLMLLFTEWEREALEHPEDVADEFNAAKSADYLIGLSEKLL